MSTVTLVGGVLSMLLTVKLAVIIFPIASFAVAVTVFPLVFTITLVVPFTV